MIGDILDGKYRIDRQLGAGGMGNVYLATHLGTTRVVAVKVIAPRWAKESQFLARFQREAQACGRLRHPNIVNVTDFGIAKAAGGDMPYLVMEFLDGQTLSDFQKANPRIGLPLIADLLDQVGLALAEAHRHGIVHRDLKPDNIWLEPNGRGGYTVKVLDFGVAKVNLLGDWAPRLGEAPEFNSTMTVIPPPILGDELETAVIEMTPEPGSSKSPREPRRRRPSRSHPLVAAVLFIFSDNLLRAAAALMAMDEQVRIRKFLSFRVSWKLARMIPVLVVTQAHSLVFFGPGWVIGDCLWPVICVVEKLRGKAAVQRSRDLMAGLRSAGRALAIRHLALAAFAIADVIKSIGFLWQSVPIGQANVVITASWFPVFALFAAAPLFLYDRTAANESGPLLQLDRTPEVRITSRAFSVSSMIWLAAGAIDLRR